MPRKEYKRTTGLSAFIKILLTGTPDEVEEAQRKEASRQIGEMQRWMKDQEKYDPIGMLWSYEEEFFPMIKRAIQYRHQIYDRTKRIAKLKFEITEAEVAADVKASGNLHKTWRDLEAEQAGLCWKIRKIHTYLKHKILLDLTDDEENPFEEYEYDPEKI